MPKKGYKQTSEHRRKHLEKIFGSSNGRWVGGGSKVERWRRKNLSKKNEANRRRELLKRSVTGSHTLGEWELLKKQYGFKCPCCLKEEPVIKLTRDHIIPISRGGSDFIENIQPLCVSCNSRKGTKINSYPMSEGEAR